MARKTVNWQGVREKFERTSFSVLSIGKDYGVSDTAINNRARKEGWRINADRAELKARVIGGSSGPVGKLEPKVSDDSPKLATVTDFPAKSWVRARELYEGTRMPLRAISRDVGIPEVDLDFKIADQGWSRFGVRRTQPSGLSEYRDGAMRDVPPSAPAAEPAPAEPPKPRVDLRKVRAPKRVIAARDKPPVEFNKARKLKSSALADMGRDAAMAYMTQLRDLIGNQDIVHDMLNEWNEDHADDDPFPTAKFEALEMLANLKELGLMLKSAGAAYRAFCEGDGAVGKKERANEEAKELAENSPFAKRRLPPRLAATDGKTV